MSALELSDLEAGLRALYASAEKLRDESDELQLQAEADYSSRPLERRPEAGFKLWIPPVNDSAYAGVRVLLGKHGLVTHGEAGIQTSRGPYRLFDWPTLDYDGRHFAVDGEQARDADDAAQLLVRSLRRRMESARHVSGKQ